MTSTASTTSVASMTSTASFHQKKYWSWWWDHPYHPNDQNQSLFLEWIIKNPFFTDIWYFFLSEAVEASQCYFFENWLIKLKCPHLLKPLGIIIQQNYWFFYPSEQFSFVHFNMIHPVYVNRPFWWQKPLRKISSVPKMIRRFIQG